MFSFIQANCGRGRAAVMELGAIMRSSGRQFALVQEPYVDGAGRITGLPSGMRVFQDRRGKAAIIVDEPDAICMPMETLTTDFGVCVRVTGRFGSIFLCSVYCQFDTDLAPYLRYLDAVLLLGSRTPVIFGLDANAVSPAWFSKLSGHNRGQASYARGELLSEWITEMRAGVLNEASRVFTFDNRRGQSDIDVTIVNQAATMWATYDWEVKEWDTSDHNMIHVVVTTDPNDAVEPIAPVPSWKLSNARWRLFEEEVVRETAELPEDTAESPLDNQVSALRSVVHSVCDRVLGRSTPRAARKVVWWTAELHSKRREVRRLRRRLQDARRHETDAAEELVLALRISSAQYKKLILRSKEDNWRRFVGENRDDPWGHVYRICRGRKKSTEIGCLRTDGRLVATWHDCAGVLLRNFFPVAESNAHIAIPIEAPPALEAFEVDACVARLKSRRSPGMDGITGAICKALWRAIPQHMTAMYSRCLETGYFPTEWKHPRVVPLLKGPDKDRTDPTSYRGICLLPVLGKVLEGIMVNRLKDTIPDGCRWQFGFRQGRCVEDAWKHVVSTVSASRSKYVLGVFVDFKGAFDNVEWNAALRRLLELGCREASLWRSFFSGRSASIVSRHGVATVPVTRGCPQGSISGPFIWNILMDVLLQRLEPLGALSAYADDLLLLIEGNARSELEQKGGELMSIVGAWGVEVGVAVSTSKTAIMLLKGILRRPPVVRFAGASLPYKRKYRYLGITVGERLSFLPHITGLRDKLTGVVGALSRVLRVDWGLSPRAKRTIYAGLMVPCALFGASVWSVVTTTQVVARRHLLACQRIILIGCLPVCRTVSTMALQVLAGAPPFDLVARRLAISFKLKRDYPLEESDWLYGEDLANLSWKQKMARLDEGLLCEWQRRWDDGDSPGRVTHRFIPNAGFVYSERRFGFTLRAGFLLTGHGSLNAFLHGRSLSDTPACLCGAEREDWQHFLCACPLYADLRDLDGLGVQYTDGDWTFSDVTASQERMRTLDGFAGLAFSRRQQLLNAQAAHGLGGFPIQAGRG